jgi:hypothetical protein
MKTLILIMFLAGCGNARLLAQGTVTFGNAPATFNTTADRYIYMDAVGSGTLLKGTQFLVQLYAGTTSDCLIPVDNIPSHMRGTSTTLPGIWTGGLPTKTIPAPIGTLDTDIFLQVRAWDSTGGLATFEQAYQAAFLVYVGVSSIFTYHVPPSGAAAGAYAMDNFRAFAVLPGGPLPLPPCPEPGIGALSFCAVIASLIGPEDSPREADFQGAEVMLSAFRSL